MSHDTVHIMAKYVSHTNYIYQNGSSLTLIFSGQVLCHELLNTFES